MKKASILDVGNFRVFYNLANLYLSNGDLTNAEITMMSGLQLQPNSEDGQYLLKLIQSKITSDY